jgi:hypothetical protein
MKMQKKLLYVFSSIGLLSTIILGVFSLINDDAEAAPPQTVVSSDELNSQEDTSLPSPVVVHQERSLTEPAVESSNSASDIDLYDSTTLEAEPTVQTDHDVLATVEQLSERYAQSLLADLPGWVLIKAERYLPDSNVPLANGELLPDQYVEETWFNVNSRGQITESLNRSLLADGNLLRQNYVNDTQEAEDNSTEQALNSVTLDYGALLRVRHALDYGSEIRGWVENEDGVEKYIVTLTDYYDNPVQFAGQLVKTSSLQARLVYNMASGQILNMNIAHQYESGESIVVESVTILDIRLIPPKSLPAEIQQTVPQN